MTDEENEEMKIEHFFVCVNCTALLLLRTSALCVHIILRRLFNASKTPSLSPWDTNLNRTRKKNLLEVGNNGENLDLQSTMAGSRTPALAVSSGKALGMGICRKFHSLFALLVGLYDVTPCKGAALGALRQEHSENNCNPNCSE